MKKRNWSVRRLSVATLIATAVLGGLAPSEANAATYYVAKTGSDSNSCTSVQSTSNPKLTIKSGLSCLKAGDILSIRAGTYNERIDTQSQTVPTGTSWSTPVTIAAYPGETVTLQPSSGYAVIQIVGNAQKYVVFDRLVVDATSVSSRAVDLDGVNLSGAGSIRFTNCEIRNAPGNGVLIGRGSMFNEFINCNFHHNGIAPTVGNLPVGHAIYIQASNNLIEGCEIHDNTGYGVHVYDGSTSAAHRNIIRRVKSYNNGANGILIGSGTGNLAYNNLVYSNGKAGIQVGFNATDNKVYNNTVYANVGEGIQIRSTSSNTQVINNIFYSNGVNINNQGANTTLSNNLTTDPLFVNARGLNFRLRSGSAAVDKGIALSEVPDDHEGTPRPAGASCDIGADEYTTSISPPAPPSAPALTGSPL